MKLLIFFSLFLLFNSTSIAQDRFFQLEETLKKLSITEPGLNQPVNLSVNDIPLGDFISGLAATNNLNINVASSLVFPITSNFSNVLVKDVILFLVKEYNLHVTTIGNIITINPYKPAPLEKKQKDPKIYLLERDKLTMDLSNDSLPSVTKLVTKLTGKNIILAPGLSTKTVSGYFENLPVLTILKNLALSNNLSVIERKDSSIVISLENEAPDFSDGNPMRNYRSGGSNKEIPGKFNYKLNGNGLISLDASNASIADVINGASNLLEKDYFLFSEPKGTITLSIDNVTYDELLPHLINGSGITYKKVNEVYLFGRGNQEGFHVTKVLKLHHRTIDKVLEIIPNELTQNLEIIPFTDLNGFVVSGPSAMVTKLETFMVEIDQVVPVVAIEVIIVEVKKSRIVQTGISAGLGNGPEKTSGTIHPGIDVNMNSASVNNLITSFNGFGIFNLGKVTPDFYLSLKLLEDNGVIKSRSVPKLSTLNGNEAKMSIGKTEYYLEVQNNIIGAQNPQNIISQQYKSVNADFSLTITPVVSADDQITLDIQVLQSDFTGRINPNAPPGLIRRDFQSLIRVRNEEMIILGGLEEESNNDSGTGLPLLARIPIIKWLFSNRLKEKSKTQLHLFIRPLIIH